MKTISRKEFAAAEKVSLSLVRKWIALGMPVAAAGGIDPNQARAWLRENTERTSDSPESLTEARARAASLLADLRTLELRQKRGELIEVALVVEEWSRTITMVRSRFLGLPSAVAPVVSQCDNIRENQVYLDAEIREILSELGKEPATGEVIANEKTNTKTAPPAA